MKTIAQQLGVTEFPFVINDKGGNRIYYEISDNSWVRYERNLNGKIVYYQDSFDYWWKCEYNSDNIQTYFEDSKGKIIDNRPKEIIKSTWSIRDCFKELRMSKENHLGLGDIKLTVAQQDEICDLVESLIEKNKELVCTNCGCPEPKKTYDGYWCKYCHNEM